MKKLLTVLIALQFSMVFMSFQAFEGAAAQGSSNPGTPATPAAPVAAPASSTAAPSPVANPAGSLSCTDALTVGKNKGTAPVINVNDIYVLLTEGIESGGGGASCGRIIECLRSKYSVNKKTADASVMTDLKSMYWQCIVTGNNGLGLLNNYAGLVYRWLAGIVGAICILVIIVSGIQISMGGLSQEEVSGAKDRIIRSFTGMVVLFLSAFILYTINPIFFS